MTVNVSLVVIDHRAESVMSDGYSSTRGLEVTGVSWVFLDLSGVQPCIATPLQELLVSNPGRECHAVVMKRLRRRGSRQIRGPSMA